MHLYVRVQIHMWHHLSIRIFWYHKSLVIIKFGILSHLKAQIIYQKTLVNTLISFVLLPFPQLNNQSSDVLRFH